MLWNFGATCGIYGVMYAGMATAEGTWSSVIVLVNFFFGIIVFHEGVKSFADTCASFVLLSFGLVGMSLYSSPSKTPDRSKSKSLTAAAYEYETISTEFPPTSNGSGSMSEGLSILRQRQSTTADEDHDLEAVVNDNAGEKGPKDTFILFGSIIISKRDIGIVASVINGLCGGTSLVPMHYAAEEGFAGKFRDTIRMVNSQ
jgi:hypothetical protein